MQLGHTPRRSLECVLSLCADSHTHLSRPARRHPEILGADTERLLNLDDEEDPGAAC